MGQNIPCRVILNVFLRGTLYLQDWDKIFKLRILHVFHRGRYIVGGGQNISGRVIVHVFHTSTFYFRRGNEIFRVD